MDSSFDRVSDGKEEWLTPPELLKRLSPFDLDPCAPVNPPWKLAAQQYTILDDGLTKPWHGFVFCNPPYGNKTGNWLDRMASHNNGIALIFARTDTKNFHRYIFPIANAMLFIEGRLTFHHVSGERGANSAGAPSVLVAYGEHAKTRLLESGIKGALVELQGSNKE